MYNVIFKIARYFLLVAAFVFNLIYIGGFVNLMELLYSGGAFEYDETRSEIVFSISSDLGDEDTWAIYDVTAAMFTAYMELAYFPTFVTNLVICTKEMFSDQFTFTYNRDAVNYGYIWEFVVYTLVIFGVPKDDEYYHDYLKRFTREYLWNDEQILKKKFKKIIVNICWIILIYWKYI